MCFNAFLSIKIESYNFNLFRKTVRTNLKKKFDFFTIFSLYRNCIISFCPITNSWDEDS